MITLQAKDKYELMAIHKLIYKSKFAENPPERMAVFSPFVARFAHEVMDKIIEANSAEGNDEEAKGWAEMMALDKEDHHVELFKKYVSEGGWWLKLSEDEKKEHVLAFFSPLRPSESIISDLSKYES
jgi:hypothetical protein